MQAIQDVGAAKVQPGMMQRRLVVIEVTLRGCLYHMHCLRCCLLDAVHTQLQALLLNQ